MANAIVLIGDLIESRNLGEAERKATQRRLNKALKQVNNDATGLTAPWTITLGDEFQAVYESADGLFPHLWAIMAAIHPVYARFSVSTGAITTPINRKQAIGMDGPAFHDARDGVNILKLDGGLLRVHLRQGAIARVINASLMLVSKEMTSWNSNRFHILRQLSRGTGVGDIAGFLGVSEVAVYKNRHAGALDDICDLTDAISELIDADLNKKYV